ncbi:PTTG1 interacting protein b [Denticeps clupeoides]|uniref:PSI domain-containing protein n=1 Tax=Denticeps clupeoides TaxID=299321 RepID=A0AAY4BA76_9TELE|nr:pituitary tumor-transforming gene 1 protein-interacting protein-like [Denticeps clupeoides]
MAGCWNSVFVALLCVLSSALVSAQTPSAPDVCASKSNTSCEECLKNVTCLWCQANQRCVDYPVRTILPPHSLCPLAEARWGLCWVNFQALIITMSVIGGAIIISVFVCCFCCCKCEKIGNKKQDERVERQADPWKACREERKVEMRARHDEIRKKYGLSKENPYSRFENN